MKYEITKEYDGYIIDIRLSRPRMYFRVTKGDKVLHTARRYREVTIDTICKDMIQEFNLM